MQYLRFNKNIMEMNRKLLKKVENHKRSPVFFSISATETTLRSIEFQQIAFDKLDICGASHLIEIYLTLHKITAGMKYGWSNVLDTALNL